MSDEFRIAPMEAETDRVDPTHAAGGRARFLHDHYCMVCDSRWWHDVGDEECVESPHLLCPEHEDLGAAHEDYYY